MTAVSAFGPLDECEAEMLTDAVAPGSMVDGTSHEPEAVESYVTSTLRPSAFCFQ